MGSLGDVFEANRQQVREVNQQIVASSKRGSSKVNEIVEQFEDSFSGNAACPETNGENEYEKKYYDLLKQFKALSGQLDTCNTDKATCESEKSAIQGQLTTCDTDKARIQGELDTFNGIAASDQITSTASAQAAGNKVIGLDTLNAASSSIGISPITDASTASTAVTVLTGQHDKAGYVDSFNRVAASDQITSTASAQAAGNKVVGLDTLNAASSSIGISPITDASTASRAVTTLKGQYDKAGYIDYFNHETSRMKGDYNITNDFQIRSQGNAFSAAQIISQYIFLCEGSKATLYNCQYIVAQLSTIRKSTPMKIKEYCHYHKSDAQNDKSIYYPCKVFCEEGWNNFDGWDGTCS